MLHKGSSISIFLDVTCGHGATITERFSTGEWTCGWRWGVEEAQLWHDAASKANRYKSEMFSSFAAIKLCSRWCIRGANKLIVMMHVHQVVKHSSTLPPFSIHLLLRGFICLTDSPLCSHTHACGTGRKLLEDEGSRLWKLFYKTLFKTNANVNPQ